MALKKKPNSNQLAPTPPPTGHKTLDCSALLCLRRCLLPAPCHSHSSCSSSCFCFCFCSGLLNLDIFLLEESLRREDFLEYFSDLEIR